MNIWTQDLLPVCRLQIVAKGFSPTITPDLVRETVLEKCGFQPRMENTQVRPQYPCPFTAADKQRPTGNLLRIFSMRICMSFVCIHINFERPRSSLAFASRILQHSEKTLHCNLPRGFHEPVPYRRSLL